MGRLLLVLACTILLGGCSYYTSIEHAGDSVYLTEDKVILGIFHRGRIYKCSAERGTTLENCRLMSAMGG